MGTIPIFIAVSVLQLQQEDFANVLYLYPFNSLQIVFMLQNSLPYHLLKACYFNCKTAVLDWRQMQSNMFMFAICLIQLT